VFDACRNELNLTRKGKKALTDEGFVPLAYTPGVMVAYATAPGQTAAEPGEVRKSYRARPPRRGIDEGHDENCCAQSVCRTLQRQM
jgi:hypothetical protein